MTNRKDNKIQNVINYITREYVPVLAALLTVAMTVRLVEVALVVYRHGSTLLNLNDVAFALLTDLKLVILISLPVPAFYLVMKGTESFIGTSAVASIIGLKRMAVFLPAIYYPATLSPLGPEFWAYGLNEMTDTLNAAENYLVLKIVAFLIIIVLLIWPLYRLMRFTTTSSEKIRKRVMGSVFGFMDLDPDYPVRTSIIRMLGEKGYHTAFFSGYNSCFDGLNYFLDYQGADLIVNKEWISNRFEGLTMDEYGFITEFSPMFNEIDSTGLSMDEQFRIVHEYALDGYYDRSRAIEERLLLNVPD